MQKRTNAKPNSQSRKADAAKPTSLPAENGGAGVAGGAGLAGGAGFCVAVYLFLATGQFKAIGGSLLVVLTDLTLAMLIFIAGCGWGRLAFGHLCAKPDKQENIFLNIATWTALGCWLISTVMLIIGTLVPGGLSSWLWRAIIIVGAALAILPLRGKRLVIPIAKKRSVISILITILFVAAAGLWTAGAVMPPGKIGVVDKDFFDVESYHLQIPREYLDNGRITALPHNTYSNYPLGGEMLFLTAMCLRGNAWDGLYAAKLTHGLWGLIAALAIFGCPIGKKTVRTSAALLFACSPMAIYLGWLAFVELAQCAFMAVAIGWLLHMRKESNWQYVVLIALACGAACSVKYLSVGLVVPPVVAGVCYCNLSGRWNRQAFRTLSKQLALTAIITLAAFSPWLIRNNAYTGNPVFPLATHIFGRGHWSQSQQDRWDAAHSSPPLAKKTQALWTAVKSPRGFGYALTALAIAGGCVTLTGKSRESRQSRQSRESRQSHKTKPNNDSKTPKTASMVLVILISQAAIWSMATHMPVRFMAPALVSTAILTACALERLRANVLIAASLVALCSLIQTGVIIRQERRVLARQWRDPEVLAGLTARDFEQISGQTPSGQIIQTPGNKLLLLGDARPLYFPAGTLYTSAWEAGPLVQATMHSSDTDEIINILKNQYGITHILLNRSEIARMHRTYGWWDQIDQSLIESLKSAGATATDMSPEQSSGSVPIVELIKLP